MKIKNQQEYLTKYIDCMKKAIELNSDLKNVFAFRIIHLMNIKFTENPNLCKCDVYIKILKNMARIELPEDLEKEREEFLKTIIQLRNNYIK
ncbi:MAG: hypothetical protein A2474_07665 [Elusimicrobia bacterium RIFOXYC2_FULL_34_12]|nr:MAG: hypothetical protein A2474_07665 [Elusimicrobia bacterium RIFOXYC2_FULL_34_12]OGS38553.1 MAG: hypothetical protein A2551_05955 [Elusimicrobia bacterium RIFOXYD2_FULL_34_30]HAM38819.1 hypothetical protein [Elusimicrobiota bacterium]